MFLSWSSYNVFRQGFPCWHNSICKGGFVSVWFKLWNWKVKRVTAWRCFIWKFEKVGKWYGSIFVDDFIAEYKISNAISRDSHRNIGLHTGARLNVVLLTYSLSLVWMSWFLTLFRQAIFSIFLENVISRTRKRSSWFSFKVQVSEL